MKKERKNLFVIFCGVLTVLVVLLIGSIIGVIAVGGLKELPGHIVRKETLFALWMSVKSACISTILCMLLAIPTAYTLARGRFALRSALETLLELTMSLPYIVLGLSLLILFSSPAGKWLKASGLAVVFSPAGIVMAQLVVNLPFAIRLVTTAFRSVDRRLECVAGLLGAAPSQQFFSVLLPLCRRSLLSAVILVWSRALGEFGATLMLVGVTRMKTETLPASIYLAVSGNDLGSALASAFLLLLLSALSLGIANGLSRRGRKRGRYE